MPSLEQLKNFINDMRAVGNEANEKAKRGIPYTALKLPDASRDVNDKEDFAGGLEEIGKREAERLKAEDSAHEEALSKLIPLGGATQDGEMPDLSMFVNEDLDGTAGKNETEKDIQADNIADTPQSNDENMSYEMKNPFSSHNAEDFELETPEEFNLDEGNDFLNEGNSKNESGAEESDSFDAETDFSDDGSLSTLEDDENKKDFDLQENDFSDFSFEEPTAETETDDAKADSNSVDNLGSFDAPESAEDLNFGDEEFPSDDKENSSEEIADSDISFDLPEEEAASKDTDAHEDEKLFDDDGFDLPEEDFSLEENKGKKNDFEDINFDDINLGDFTGDGENHTENKKDTAQNENAEMKDTTGESDFDAEDFNPYVGDNFSNEGFKLDEEEESEGFGKPKEENTSESEKTDFPDFSLDDVSASSSEVNKNESDSAPEEIDLSDMDFGEFSTETENDAKADDTHESIGESEFDFPESDGNDDFNTEDLNFRDEENQKDSLKDDMDFNLPEEEQNGFDIDLPEETSLKSDAAAEDASTHEGDNFNIDNKVEENDFELEDKDDIVSQVENFDIAAKPAPKKKENINEQDKNHELSREEYERFLENLASYPLNVRLAVEEMMVKSEFKNETEFEIIQKIIKKVSAVRLAHSLEKLLDKSIPVPRNYEKRSAAEYDAYKKSLAYQLRNRIIPAALISMAGVFFAFLFFMSGKFFVYEPLRSTSIYKQGYNLLKMGEYPASVDKFNAATKIKPQKKWFLKYAQGYRDAKQFSNADQVYKLALLTFKHDKQVGLEYAEMMLYDMANYERAEEIVKREILDHHVNDEDARLLLGDIYLEWADEKDEEKFELARTEYNGLILKNKDKKRHFLYLSRLLRYFIRTDNLSEVLRIKDEFMQKQKMLDGKGWNELGGYLFDKMYGELSVTEEHLRGRIEDVKKCLVNAIEKTKQNPVAYYNMGRYYTKMNNNLLARQYFENSLKFFERASPLKKRDEYKNINAFTLLGENYLKSEEYLKAREIFTQGISLFNRKSETAGLEGNKDVGKLFCDLGNLNYFISNDLDSALGNFEDAVRYSFDNAALRYKIGYIYYAKENYEKALYSFIEAAKDEAKDPHLLLATGNVLSLKGNNYMAEGYYERLLDYLNAKRNNIGMLFPQSKTKDREITELYLKATNNLGVTLNRLASRTSDSAKNAEAFVNMQESMRAWDALTRNQKTMTRLGGSNLAEQNVKYMANPVSNFKPAIYTEIPNTLAVEEILK